jgi:hypothetical protein
MSFLQTSTFFDSSKSHDVILQSSDNILFYLTRATLSAQSSVFETMFSLPAKDDEIQTVKMGVGSKTLELLLRYLLLLETPPLPSFDQLLLLLSLCDKYELRHVPLVLLNEMLKFVAKRPLEVWAYCTIYGAGEIAKLTFNHFDDICKDIKPEEHWYPARVDNPASNLDGKWNRPISPSDLPTDLLAQIPPSSLHRLLLCYDLVLRGRSWAVAGKSY